MAVVSRGPRGAERRPPPWRQNRAQTRAWSQIRPTERRWNRTIQAEGCSALPVLKTGWATRPLPLRKPVYGPLESGKVARVDPCRQRPAARIRAQTPPPLEELERSPGSCEGLVDGAA